MITVETTDVTRVTRMTHSRICAGDTGAAPLGLVTSFELNGIFVGLQSGKGTSHRAWNRRQSLARPNRRECATRRPD